jgi:hypothetical protein
MANVSIVRPGDGETFSNGPLRMRLLEDGSTTDHRLGMAEIEIAPHMDGPPQHRHAQHDEGFYVISGTVRFTIGQESVDAAGLIERSPDPLDRRSTRISLSSRAHAVLPKPSASSDTPIRPRPRACPPRRSRFCTTCCDVC